MTPEIQQSLREQQKMLLQGLRTYSVVKLELPESLEPCQVAFRSAKDVLFYDFLSPIDRGKLTQSGRLEKVHDLDGLARVVEGIGPGMLGAFARVVSAIYAVDHSSASEARRKASGMLRDWSHGMLEGLKDATAVSAGSGLTIFRPAA